MGRLIRGHESAAARFRLDLAKRVLERCCSVTEQFIGCDASKKFSVFVAVDEKSQARKAHRVTHDRQGYRDFLAQLPAQSAVAMEATGHYGWIVDEIYGRFACDPRRFGEISSYGRCALTERALASAK